MSIDFFVIENFPDKTFIYVDDGQLLYDVDNQRKIYTQLKYLFEQRRDLVKKYFMVDKFEHSDFKKLCTELQCPIDGKLDKEEDLKLFLERTKELILSYLDSPGKKNIAHRIYGYLIKGGYYVLETDKDPVLMWNEFIDRNDKIDPIFISDPGYPKGSKNIEKFNEKLKTIEVFFLSNGYPIQVTYLEEKGKNSN